MSTVVSLDYQQQIINRPRKLKANQHATKVDPRLCGRCEMGLVRPGHRICPGCEKRTPDDQAFDKDLAAWTAIALAVRPSHGEEMPVELAREVMKMVKATGLKPSRPRDRRGRTAGVKANRGRSVRVRKASGQLAS